MEIRLDDLSGPEIGALINEHLQNMTTLTPPGSMHALGLESLRHSDITCWSAWQDKELVGCGALKELDGLHGEVKSMRTSSAYLRKGIAKGMLRYLMEEARRRGYRRLSLETGSGSAFKPARQLYASFGFQYCQPFSDYVDDSNSLFMTKEL